MPSYRPQANTSQDRPANCSATACRNGSPDGAGTTRVGDAAVPAMLWLSWTHPLAFFAALAVAVGVGLALTLLLFGFLLGLLRRFFPGRAAGAPASR